MTKEEKQLLLIDLCARLPYGVIVKENDGVNENDNKLLDIDMFDRCINYDYIIEDIKPYLRSIESMTEEEYEEYHATFWHEDYGGLPSPWSATYETFDWFNAHHFDFRGLIRMKLAIEAPKDMYKIE